MLHFHVMKWTFLIQILIKLTSNLKNNFDGDDPDTIILIRLLAWHFKFEKHKVLKKELKD